MPTRGSGHISEKLFSLLFLPTVIHKSTKRFNIDTLISVPLFLTEKYKKNFVTSFAYPECCHVFFGSNVLLLRHEILWDDFIYANSAACGGGAVATFPRTIATLC